MHILYLYFSEFPLCNMCKFILMGLVVRQIFKDVTLHINLSYLKETGKDKKKR